MIPVGLADQYHDPRGIWAVMGPLIGWSFVGVGLYAARRPASRSFGVLMVVTGFAWFVGVLTLIDEPLILWLGLPLGSIWLALVAYGLLAFPSGRLDSTADRVVAGTLLVGIIFIWIPLLLLTPDPGRCSSAATAPPTRWRSPMLNPSGEVLVWARVGLLVAGFGAMCVLLGRRWWRARRPSAAR